MGLSQLQQQDENSVLRGANTHTCSDEQRCTNLLFSLSFTPHCTSYIQYSEISLDSHLDDELLSFDVKANQVKPELKVRSEVIDELNVS